jgi:hypothetical protein
VNNTVGAYVAQTIFSGSVRISRRSDLNRGMARGRDERVIVAGRRMISIVADEMISCHIASSPTAQLSSSPTEEAVELKSPGRSDTTRPRHAYLLQNLSLGNGIRNFLSTYVASASYAPDVLNWPNVVSVPISQVRGSIHKFIVRATGSKRKGIFLLNTSHLEVGESATKSGGNGVKASKFSKKSKSSAR